MKAQPVTMFTVKICFLSDFSFQIISNSSSTRNTGAAEFINTDGKSIETIHVKLMNSLMARFIHVRYSFYIRVRTKVHFLISIFGPTQQL
jgi:hypothetical protein